jgi:hypothetical protein
VPGARSLIRADIGWPGLTTDGFLVRLKEAVSSSRPNFPETPSAAAVQDGRRPPPQAARSVLDSGEYGVKLGQVGIILMPRIDLSGELLLVATVTVGEMPEPRSIRLHPQLKTAAIRQFPARCLRLRSSTQHIGQCHRAISRQPR